MKPVNILYHVGTIGRLANESVEVIFDRLAYWIVDSRPQVEMAAAPVRHWE